MASHRPRSRFDDSRYDPSYWITDRSTLLLGEIVRRLCEIKSLYGGIQRQRLRESNRIRAIQPSLAIEQNTLDLEQVAAILQGGTVIGDLEDIREVRNAIRAYD